MFHLNVHFTGFNLSTDAKVKTMTPGGGWYSTCTLLMKSVKMISPKRIPFSGLRFMWTKGRDLTSLGVAKCTENCHLGMKQVFQCVSKRST